jgi:hypothetical protein
VLWKVDTSHLAGPARRVKYGIVLVAITYAGYAQESPVAHATRVLDLLEAGKFEDVAAEFNAKMAATMPVSRLRDMWTTVSRQAGARTSIIRQRVVTQATGNVTVLNVCLFEKTALAVMVSFDAENRIAGMNITPVTPPGNPVLHQCPPASRRNWSPLASGNGRSVRESSSAVDASL